MLKGCSLMHGKKKAKSVIWFWKTLLYRPGWLLGIGVFICFYLEVDPIRTQFTLPYNGVTLATSQKILELWVMRTQPTLLVPTWWILLEWSPPWRFLPISLPRPLVENCLQLSEDLCSLKGDLNRGLWSINMDRQFNTTWLIKS